MRYGRESDRRDLNEEMWGRDIGIGARLKNENERRLSKNNDDDRQMRRVPYWGRKNTKKYFEQDVVMITNMDRDKIGINKKLLFGDKGCYVINDRHLVKRMWKASR